MGTVDEYWQGRIVDLSGTIYTHAGQYQYKAAGMLRDTEPPAFVAAIGKPRTYETDDGTITVSLRPEHLTIVDERTRHRWIVETAERTLERIDRFDESTNEYVQMARTQYGDAVEQYCTALIEALKSLDEADPDRPSDPANEAGETDRDSDSDSDPITQVSDEETNEGPDVDADSDRDLDGEPSPTAMATEPPVGDDEASDIEANNDQSAVETLDDFDKTEDIDAEDDDH